MATPLPAEIDPADLAQKLKDGEAVVVDVREAVEFVEAHIPGALLMPLSTFDPAVFVRLYNDKPVVIHCLAGPRAYRAADAIVAAGGKRPSILRNSITGWKAAGLPVESGMPGI
jgi:rhodanese-related sulfurtransferase